MTWGETDDRDLRFALQPAAGVQGVATWANGAPMSLVKLSFRPVFAPGEFSGIVASRLDLEDEVISTDGHGRFTCTSLRPGAYRVKFPDHPKWPALKVPEDAIRSGRVRLRAHWQAPRP